MNIQLGNTTIRNHIWYVTIDHEDNCRPDHNRHRRNLTRLQEIATKEGIQVDPIWMPNLSAEMLNAKDLLAVFGAGSFGEWFDTSQNRVWAERINSYCELLRHSHVPMLAVCGSHQVVVRAFGDWDSIGHMSALGEPVISIGDEFRQQQSLIPRPRLGEIGDFPLRVLPDQRNDPLFAGLPDLLWFVQSHCDQAIAGRTPAFVNLMESAIEHQPLFLRPNAPPQEGRLGHRNPYHPSERCQVQALRLDTSERVLYSLGFHPEMPAWVDPVNEWQSERLLHNFFQIARGFWG